MRVTRDSALWTWSLVASLVAGLVTLGNGVTAVGLPLAAVPYIRLAAFIVGIVGAKLGNSPLKGENDHPAGAVNPTALGKP